MRNIGKTIELLINTEARKATKYLSDKSVITATRRVYKGKIDKRNSNIEIVLKIGRPNYEEREFIQKCKKAKEPFPIKKIQLKHFKK